MQSVPVSVVLPAAATRVFREYRSEQKSLGDGEAEALGTALRDYEGRRQFWTQLESDL